MATMKSNKLKPATMDPVLIQAFARGRAAGIKEAQETAFFEGKKDGIAETIMRYYQWISEIDEHVKGYGPKRKAELEAYLGDRLKESVEHHIKSSKKGL